MATFTEIKEFRLDIADPANCINIISIANTTALPAIPAQQTVYYLADTGNYVKTDLESGAVAADYYFVDLNLSDTRIATWIDEYDSELAIKYGLKAIIKKLGSQLPIVKNDSGRESIEYQRISDMYKYYKGLLADVSEDIKVTSLNSTGRFGQMIQPEIAGGNI